MISSHKCATGEYRMTSLGISTV